MKRKVFSILFEVCIIFVVLADVLVLVLRLEQGIIRAVGCSLFFLLGIIYEIFMNKKEKKAKIFPFNKKLTSDSNKAEATCVVGALVAFGCGIVFKMQWPFITIMSMVCFYIGALQGKQYK